SSVPTGGAAPPTRKPQPKRTARPTHPRAGVRLGHGGPRDASGPVVKPPEPKRKERTHPAPVRLRRRSLARCGRARRVVAREGNAQRRGGGRTGGGPRCSRCERRPCRVALAR